ncbi:putative NLR family CARD domain-containing protein 4 [Apostichopus japonicus]|uniref:Putative NLR family CARD domain-containing protein 4 n=1 Tax=Stichopus japonicus TaxID=307972 RepID=A0A2G8KX15_STIJA|nr:putative NLR family CARD domain-containing protein 4 [Apostichopus japonicus]
MKPILLYKDGVKTGDGFDSGEFDIYPNGSLVIRTVATKYEAVYTVSKVISSLELPVSYDISVQTIVTPTNTIPAVEQCSYVFDNICVKTTVSHIKATCSIKESRPAIYLSWAKRTHERDYMLPSNYMNFTNNNVTYTSRTTTEFVFEDSIFLTLLVCQASSVPLNWMKEENIILIERQTDYTSMFTPDKTYVKIHSRMYLSCNDRTLNLLMWKRSRGREADVETMFVSIFQPSNLTQLTYKEYRLEVDGSISLQNTLVEHEGLYACLHDNGVSGGIKLHNVSVIAQDKITVECHAVGENSELFSLSTKVDLLFNNVLLRDRDSNILTIAIIVGALITLIVIISVVLVSRCRKRRARRRKPIGIVINEVEETIPMMKSDTCYSEKAERFIKQLKAKYEIFYDSVQPIPYIKDRMYCVDKVFVEGSIEIMTGISEGEAQWDKLSSYQELVKESCLKTKRHILEGEPGYGKSTLTLQLLYDWCKSLSKSPLRGVDVIIYLRLRQLSGVKSILSAIKRFILPMDSDISERDIKEILNQMNSVLVLLDGFDEYPDQESTETDIYHIMNKNMFQEFNVILTTRPSCVPQGFAPHSDRGRLTGFGEEARKRYVEKAVIGKGGKSVDKIMRKLQKNPVLGDLCQVPLFFVMFAHMTYEKEHFVTFNSVTSFFRYMIASFHSHKRNKMKDENVEKFELMEHEHKELDKVAFEALSGKNQTIVWDRQQLCNHLGHEFYDQYIRIGILVEEEVINIADTLHPQSDIQYKQEVRFYHKLFCEWYAAHYVAEQLQGGRIDSIHSLLQNLDPFDLQYVYRFACGLNKIAAEKIIQYLQHEIEGKKFAILCMLEQADQTDRFIKTVYDLVSSSVTTINKDESKLLQRSTLQILDAASKNQVPIYCLVLDKGLDEANDDGISLEDGFHIPVLSTIKKLEIRLEKGTELTQDETLGVFSYAQECHNLKNLTFVGCLLPLSFSLKFLSSFIKAKHLQVSSVQPQILQSSKIPSRSPDLNPIENIFKLLGDQLKYDAIENNIEFETFRAFRSRVVTTLLQMPRAIIDKAIASMGKRMMKSFEEKERELKY